jgi:shikimate kinase
MGCGKSYTGKTIAPVLGFEFVDMDNAIEEKEGMSIKDIFAQKGENYFRNLEHQYLLDLDKNQNLVVSTGGGAPCFSNNMNIMNEKGITVYLNRSKDIVIPRLKKGMHKRPLIQDMSEKELIAFYDSKLAERSPFYEKAKFFVGNAEAEDIVKMIM